MRLRTLFTQEKRYRIGKLKPHIYLFDKSDTMILYDKNECYDIASDSSYILHCASAKFVSNSSESGKYQFKSTIEIVLDETTAIDNYSILKQLLMKEWFVGFETLEGDRFLMSPEFESEVTYTFTANDTEKTNNTTVTFTVNTNIPNITVLTDFTYNHVMRGEYCGYQIGEITELRLGKADDTTVLINEASYNVIGSAVEVVEYSPNTLSFTEEYNGTSFNQTLQFEVPYEAFQHDFHYELLEFVKNEYLALMRTRLGNYVLAGHDLGMLPQYSISTSENNTPNTVQITLSYTSSSHGLLVADSISFEAGDDTTYTVEDWRCIDNLYSGTLVKGVSSEGTSYYCFEGYESEYPNYNITSTYADIYTSQFGIKLYNTSVSCTSTDEDTCNVSGLPSTVTFTEIGQTQVFDVISDCPLIFRTQDNCEVSLENNKLSITNLVDDNYTITVRGDGYLHTINVIVAIQTETNSYYDITAEAQTLNVSLEQSIANIVGTVKPATVTILPTEDNLGYYVTVPQNNSFTDTVEYVIRVTYSNDDVEIITITQDHMYERYVNDGTQMCDGNDLYDYAKHYIGYYSDDINIDDGYVKISLNTANSSECTQDLGESIVKETVCLNGFIYTVLDIYDGDGNFLYTKAEKTTESCEDGNYDPDGDGTTQTTYERWVTNDLMQECVDGVVYAYEVREISTDNTNWYSTDERRLSTKVIEDSDLCDIIGDTTDNEKSYMTATPSTLTFSASGGTKRVSVQYNHPIYDVFSNEGTSATWCTSVGVGSNYYNTYQEEGHDITVAENTSSEARECIVIYAYQNAIGEEVEATVTVYQEGSTLQTRDIVLDITSDYTCDGTSKYYTIAHQESTDGVFWTTVSTSLGDLYEENSPDCGFANPASITLVTPSLDVNYAAQNKYIQVNYINASSINAPIYDASWVSVTQNQSGSTTTNGDPTLQVQYKLAILASTESRSEDITFSCFGKDGGTAEATFKLTQTVNPQYKTSEINPLEDWICVGYDKYIKVEQQVSYDNGNTWVTTATTQGDLFESNSTDCGVKNGIYEVEGEQYFTFPIAHTYDCRHDKVFTPTNNLTYDVAITAEYNSALVVGYKGGGEVSKIIISFDSANYGFGTTSKIRFVSNGTSDLPEEDYVGNFIGNTYEVDVADVQVPSAFSGYGFYIELWGDSTSLPSYNDCGCSASITVTVSYELADTRTFKYTDVYERYVNNVLVETFVFDEGSFQSCGRIPEYDSSNPYTYIEYEGCKFPCAEATFSFDDGVTEYAYIRPQNQFWPLSSTTGCHDCLKDAYIAYDYELNGENYPAPYECNDSNVITIIAKQGMILGANVTDGLTSAYRNSEELDMTKFGITTFDEGDIVELHYGTTTVPRLNDTASEAYSIEISEGFTTVADRAFELLTSESISLPKSLTTIGQTSFMNNVGVTDISHLTNLTSIGGNAFYNCTNLQAVIIPASVTSLGIGAFRGCTSLTSLTINNGLTELSRLAFNGCTALKNIVIPDSVTSIDQDAFSGCTSLETVEIGSGITSIGRSSFGGCTSLNSVYCHATTAPSIQALTFWNVATGGVLYYPSGSDYSSWLDSNMYYLGYYEWFGQEI